MISLLRARRALLLSAAVTLVGSQLASINLASAQQQQQRQARQQQEQGQQQQAQQQQPQQEAPTGLWLVDAITLYADRAPKRLLDVPQTVSVIGSQELEQRMVRDINDLVRYEPGVTVNKFTSSVDPFGNSTGFTIRGVSGNRVQMLIDGTRIIESIQDGNRDFIDMSNLKAVEIIRGPAGVMWGADALGGVVAFTTKDPEDYLKGRNYGGQLSTYFDSYDNTFYKSAAVAARWGQFAASLSIGQRTFHEAELSNARADGGVYGCPRELTAIRCNELNPLNGNDLNILGKLVWTPNAEHEVKLTHEMLDKHSAVNQLHDLGREHNTSNFGLTGNYNLGYFREQDQTRRRWTLEHRYTPNLGWLDNLKWQASYSPQRRLFTGNRFQQLADTTRERYDSLLDYKEEFYEADLQLNSSFSSLGALHKLTYGGYFNVTKSDYQRQEIRRNLTTGAGNVANAGGFNFTNADTRRADAFLQDEINFFNGRIVIAPGVRLATYELEPRPNSFYKAVPGKEPRTIDSQKLLSQISGTIHWTDQYSTYARFAEGFKMPTAQQLFTTVPNANFPTGDLIPNPDLKAESVESYEIGLRGKFNDGYFSLSIFKSDYDNFIQSFQPVASQTRPGVFDLTYLNLSRVNLWGVEFSTEWRVYDKWTVSVAASYVDGTQQTAAGARVTKFDGTTPITVITGLRYLDPATGIDAQLISTWADKVGGRAAITTFRPSSYAVFDGVFSWKPVKVPGLILNASILNILDTRYFRAGVTGYSIPPSLVSAGQALAVAASNPLELQTAPGRTFKVGANYEF